MSIPTHSTTSAIQRERSVSWAVVTFRLPLLVDGSSLGLPERDLAAGRRRDDAAPARRPLSRVDQDRRAEHPRPVGGLADPGDLDVGQPQGAPRVALDDTAAHGWAHVEREIRAAS